MPEPETPQPQPVCRCGWLGDGYHCPHCHQSSDAIPTLKHQPGCSSGRTH